VDIAPTLRLYLQDDHCFEAEAMLLAVRDNLIAPSLIAELEKKMNEILVEDHPLKSYLISEEEFRKRPDLLRTLDAQPPVSHGKVRVVEIESFDAQACGGTHMHNTSEVGRFSIFRTDNKGKNNKRLYVKLESV
jgi:Ser-tRNA(Ala) deacylase AlaX